MTSKIVVSPKLEINSYDWKSVFRGLVLMWSVTSGIFLVGILEGFLKNPEFSYFTQMDWKATFIAYLGAVSVAFVTAGVNAIKKFIQANEYIK